MLSLKRACQHGSCFSGSSNGSDRNLDWMRDSHKQVKCVNLLEKVNFSAVVDRVHFSQSINPPFNKLYLRAVHSNCIFEGRLVDLYAMEKQNVFNDCCNSSNSVWHWILRWPNLFPFRQQFLWNKWQKWLSDSYDCLLISAVVKVWLGLGMRTTWLRLGNDISRFLPQSCVSLPVATSPVALSLSLRVWLYE